MTTLDTTHSHKPGARPLAQLSFNIATLAARLTAYRERRATRAALEKLSDRELEDVGLTRAEIYARF